MSHLVDLLGRQRSSRRLLDASAAQLGEPAHRLVHSSTPAVRLPFVRDHIGGWLDVWHARVHAIRELSPWFGVVGATSALVRSEARHRNVVPITPAGPIAADAGIPDDGEPLLDCGDDTDTS